MDFHVKNISTSFTISTSAHTHTKNIDFNKCDMCSPEQEDESSACLNRILNVIGKNHVMMAQGNNVLITNYDCVCFRLFT